MALIQAGNYPAGAPSTITLPLNGRPWADLTLATPAVPWREGDRVQVRVEGGPTYQMTVERVGPCGGFARVRLMGGSGGLSRDIPARWYRDIEAVKVLREIIEDCGESAGELNLPGKLPTWVRPTGPAHEALRALMMRYPHHIWQMTPDGQLSVGLPNWREHGAPLPVEAEDAAAGVWTCGLRPSLRPGEHIELVRGDEKFGKRVTRVTHSVTKTYKQLHLRTLVGSGNGQDSGITGLDMAVQRAVRWVDYLALYPAEVLRDHGDHTLDLRPEHPLLPEMTHVRLVQPLPGTRIKLKAGGTVLLGFQAGDPARPLAQHYGAAELELLDIVTGQGQSIRIDDDRGQRSPDESSYANPTIRVQDAAGQQVELRPKAGEIRLRANTRVLVDSASEVQVKGETVNIKAQAATIDAASVRLAGGGPPVARVGDTITGTCPAGPVTGTITSGSGKVVSG
ncbi:hypothetical protein ACFP81_10730 [Deinococcus lacus]|uniref:Gp5/Type VI secretion system Vgr protein OB-fold domain-containing protein n=1 Tax=Deinococcus lacus TaxID=392561 RepID=A0ABW1YDN5_9DEIO